MAGMRFSWVLGVLVAMGAACGGEDAPPNGSEDGILVFATVRSTACDVQPYPRVSDFLNFYQVELTPKGQHPVYNKIYRCTNGAETCQDIKACYGVGGSCDMTYKAICDGGKAVFCDLIDNTTFTFDCAGSGLGCKVDATNPFVATCTGAGDEKPLPTTVACEDARCTKTTEACTQDDYNRCDGDRLQACLAGTWLTIDCAALGLGACTTVTVGVTKWARCSPPVI